MHSRDIPHILKLEAGTLSAWSKPHLEDELRQRTGFQFVVRSRTSGKIRAVLCGRLVADEAEILKLSVAADARRQGVGLQLMNFVLNYCSARGARNCFLELRASNTAARNLYIKRGFFILGFRKNYYDKPLEDAVLMQLTL